MSRFQCYSLFIILFCFVIRFEVNVEAKAHRALVVVDEPRSNDPVHTRVVDMLTSSFVEPTVVSTDELTEETLQSDAFRFLIYYGPEQKKLSDFFVNYINTFRGKVLWIGENGEQVTRITNVAQKENDTIVRALQSKKHRYTLENEVVFFTLKPNKGTRVYMNGISMKGEEPVLVGNGRTYVFGTRSVFSDVGEVLSHFLVTFFNRENKRHSKKFIWIEDVHPQSDAKKLQEMTDYLYDREIPYFVSIIPVYRDGWTGKEVRFADVPELAKVIRTMNTQGASFILHGYTHQYRESVTGQGFEFWDVRYDRPVYQAANEVVNRRIDVAVGEAYQKKYITSRIESALKELAALGIKPVAFEAPNYAFPPDSYGLLADYFSTYIGKVQVSNTTYKSMYTTPYISKPTFAQGMTVIPDTIGYVRSGVTAEQMVRRANELAEHNGTIISGYYHPFLGMSQFETLVKGFEQLEHVQWMSGSELNRTTSVAATTEARGLTKFALRAVPNETKTLTMFQRAQQSPGYVFGLICLVFLAISALIYFRLSRSTKYD
ncbi:MAG: DUF2334 domain-containing protein [Bacilli bacterium]